MKRCLLVVLIAVMAGCSTGTPTSTTAQPTGTLTLTKPAGGEIFKVGDPVTIAWTCDACSGIPAGDYILVSAYDGVALYPIITNASFTDTKTWTAGATLQTVALLPGFYQIVLQDAAGLVQVASPIFQLVPAS